MYQNRELDGIAAWHTSSPPGSCEGCDGSSVGPGGELWSNKSKKRGAQWMDGWVEVLVNGPSNKRSLPLRWSSVTRLRVRHNRTRHGQDWTDGATRASMRGCSIFCSESESQSIFMRCNTVHQSVAVALSTEHGNTVCCFLFNPYVISASLAGPISPGADQVVRLAAARWPPPPTTKGRI